MSEQTMDGPKQRNEQVVGAVVLIGVGVLFLLAQFVDFGILVLPLIAAGFLIAGVVSKQPGWFVPSGILGGIALGVTLSERFGSLGEQAEGGLFLASFALGWVSISLLCWVFSRQVVRWPLIPGGILGTIGSALLLGEQGQRMLTLVFTVFGYAWPIALIVAGVAMLLKYRRVRE